MSAAVKNPFEHIVEPLDPKDPKQQFFNLSKLGDPRYDRLPFSIRVLLESAVRNCDEFLVKRSDVESILNWKQTQFQTVEVPFRPARVILQDFTGVPAVVDFAAMRDAVMKLGGDPEKINPVCPADLVIDHSIQVDFNRKSDSLQKNQDLEFDRNKERFQSETIRCELCVKVKVHRAPSGVGGIEAEAVMLGQPISMVLPEVVGYKVHGAADKFITSTDIVLTVTKHLRQVGVVGKFVEFFGPGVAQLSIADRATIANMCPEYGATAAFFPVDDVSLQYLEQTGREPEKLAYITQYLKAVAIFRDYNDVCQDPEFTQVVELDLSTVVPCCSGPKRPQDRIPVSDMKKDFEACLEAKQGFKGFQVAPQHHNATAPFQFNGKEYALSHGSVVIAAITSCTNTSNPSVMLGAGLLAKKAVECGLSVSVPQGDLIAAGVLSGNRNFEGRVHPNTRANYLASPPLVIAYALAGTVRIDFENEPIAMSSEGKEVFLRDIWPTREEIQAVERMFVIPSMFKEVYEKIENVNERWNSLAAPSDKLYTWDPRSTYIKSPPFFDGLVSTCRTRTVVCRLIQRLCFAFVEKKSGLSVVYHHHSQRWAATSSAYPGKRWAFPSVSRVYAGASLRSRDYNSYGSRRGNDAVMARGTFANIRLFNKFLNKQAPQTVHLPTGETLDVFDAADRYQQSRIPLLVLAGKEYGSGSSRDWAAKGPFLLGIKAVLAESYERIHRSNLVGMGVIPLEYLPGDTADSLGLTGRERYSVVIPEPLTPRMVVDIKLDSGKTFQVRMRFDTDVELAYFRHGGILNYMIRKMSES
ncbi:cytoplasmic aconitate hydratase [Neolamprologus brichardi]|uniref:cytoplasmic aconitate hydratase n=1 Tax=Neolamprologus brichardi TaxID=32507 RepID=UPI001643DA0A|nr:cytoplasmic aconitate hydratase [Neolamprologus brichardi]